MLCYFEGPSWDKQWRLVAINAVILCIVFFPSIYNVFLLRINIKKYECNFVDFLKPIVNDQ